MKNFVLSAAALALGTASVLAAGQTLPAAPAISLPVTPPAIPAIALPSLSPALAPALPAAVPTAPQPPSALSPFLQFPSASSSTTGGSASQPGAGGGSSGGLTPMAQMAHRSSMPQQPNFPVVTIGAGPMRRQVPALPECR